MKKGQLTGRIGKKEYHAVVKKIGLVVKADAEAHRKADELEAWLSNRGASVLRKDNPPPEKRVAASVPARAPADLFCIFVLGGDGTFLSAVRWIGDQPIPILGVKFGEVGFLAEATEDSLIAVAETILDDAFSTAPRTRLTVRVERDGKERVNETVLNDVTINKGALARLAYIDTAINDQHLTTYVADGLIIATPTGSTAYSLAAGGPIIHPEVPGIIITPICPFTLTIRPLIVPDSVCIKMQLTKRTADIMLTFDGQVGLEIDVKDQIFVEKAASPIHMITIPEQGYFDVVKAKLRWSGGRV